MVLVIDSYDSFAYNLARYIQNLGFETKVIRHDKLTLNDIEQLKPSHIVLSPGPCTPNEAGITLEVVKTFYQTIPILGVCLGHQTIAQAFGARIIQAAYPRHGKASQIEHNGSALFHHIRNPLKIARYHSLVIEPSSLNDCLNITAKSLDDHEIMAIQHKDYPVYGVQFHPESILTEQGLDLLANFFK